MEIWGLTLQNHFGNHGQFRRKKATHSLDKSTSEETPREIGKAGIRISDDSPVEHLGDEFVSVGIPAPALLPTVESPTSKFNDGNAKGFWNHFMFRRRSGFQSVLPIQNNEVHQEKCRAIPFWQVMALSPMAYLNTSCNTGYQQAYYT